MMEFIKRIWMKLLRMFNAEQTINVDDMRATVAAIVSRLAPFNERTEYERDLALWEANPLAFWLRPDRHEYDKPCWMVEAPSLMPRPESPQYSALLDCYLQASAARQNGYANDIMGSSPLMQYQAMQMALSCQGYLGNHSGKYVNGRMGNSIAGHLFR